MGSPQRVRKWVSADEWLKAVGDTPEVVLPPRARPVDPVSDQECYSLNSPASCSKAKKQAGLTGMYQRQARLAEAEQHARRQAAARLDRGNA
jgi:hypothetical protein